MKVGTFFKRLGKDLLADNVTDVGAMMAYYAVMALFPMLVFVLTTSLLVLDADTVRQGANMAASALPASVRELLISRVNALIDAAGAGFAIVGATLALWGASRGAMSLMTALNTMFSKKETRPYWKRNLIAIAVTVGVTGLIVISLGLLVVGPHIGHWAMDRFGLGDTFDTAWSIGRWVGAGLLVMIVWAIIYKFLPDTDAPFRVFTPGAIAGVILWLGISYAFGIYLDHFNSYEATYGTLGGAIIFLTWLWLSNVTILFGAEVNDVLADLRAPKDAGAAQLADAGENSHKPERTTAPAGPRRPAHA